MLGKKETCDKSFKLEGWWLDVTKSNNQKVQDPMIGKRKRRVTCHQKVDPDDFMCAPWFEVQKQYNSGMM